MQYPWRILTVTKRSGSPRSDRAVAMGTEDKANLKSGNRSIHTSREVMKKS